MGHGSACPWPLFPVRQFRKGQRNGRTDAVVRRSSSSHSLRLSSSSSSHHRSNSPGHDSRTPGSPISSTLSPRCLHQCSLGYLLHLHRLGGGEIIQVHGLLAHLLKASIARFLPHVAQPEGYTTIVKINAQLPLLLLYLRRDVDRRQKLDDQEANVSLAAAANALPIVRECTHCFQMSSRAYKTERFTLLQEGKILLTCSKSSGYTRQGKRAQSF